MAASCCGRARVKSICGWTASRTTNTGRRSTSLLSTVFEIVLIDIVFSLDSVITAVGMADDIGVMIAAIVVAIFVMLVASGRLRVHRSPCVGEDAGAVVLAADRHGAGRRWLPLPRAARLRLRGYGILDPGGEPQSDRRASARSSSPRRIGGRGTTGQATVTTGKFQSDECRPPPQHATQESQS